MNSLPRDLRGVSRDAILVQLGKIVASAAFQGSERSTKLLRYLVEQSANGQTGCLKEYTLGVEVLGKASTFDPRTDTIVRAEASRLRTRLEKYYAAEGQGDPLVIALPKGNYVPQFQSRTLARNSAVGLEGGPPSQSKNITRLALGVGVAACLLVLIAWSFWRSPQPVARVQPDTTVALAVLPFVNISGDPSQDFFSDGMTEEITSVLAKVPDLRVLGRTSAFQFKGQNRDLRAIGQALGATHLIEGSVRKEGNRLRITAQLIEAGNGVHLWAESYDRELTDVFAIQEDIAKSIAISLRVPLGLKPGETLITNRIADPEIYEQYLRGRALLRLRNVEGWATLENLVTRAPEFAPGWAMLADAYGIGVIGEPRHGNFRMAAWFQDKAEAAARKAIQLDPSFAGGYFELATQQAGRGKWAEAEDLFKRALALDSNDPELLQSYGGVLTAAGRLKEALRMYERLRALEPLVPLYSQITARLMQANGQIDASIAILEPYLVFNEQRNVNLAQAYAIKGRFADAADTLLRLTNGQIDRRAVEDAARLLRSAPSKTVAPEKLPALDAELGFVYVDVGAPERMLEYPEKAVSEGIFRAVNMVWNPVAAPLRKTERFKALMRKAGLVDYWKARGWPDLCRPVGADDFVCD